jgi:hypothetical protein
MAEPQANVPIMPSGMRLLQKLSQQWQRVHGTAALRNGITVKITIVCIPNRPWRIEVQPCASAEFDAEPVDKVSG